MKKLLVVLLSLGLIAGFSMSASAADVQFTGSYYVAGAYDNNPYLIETGASQAYVYQQVRLKPIFKVAEGLTFTLRADMLEKQWGDARWVVSGFGAGTGTTGNPTSTSDKNGTRLSTGTANVATAENIDVEQAYVTFATGLGEFKVGYQDTNAWGTGFGNSPGTNPGVTFSRKMGNFTVGFEWMHLLDYTTAVTSNTNNYVDIDSDTYALMGVYKAGAVEAGMLWKWYNDKSRRQVSNYAGSRHLLQPYAKLTFGPVFVETELSYLFGKNRQYESPATNVDIDEQSWSAYINANMKFGPATIGALAAMVSGDDKTADKQKGSLNCGYAWNPALILMNSDMKWWGGSNHVPNAINRRPYISSTTANGMDDAKANTVWYGLYGNYAATPKLSLGAALTFAQVQTKKLTATTEADSANLGTEFDMTATYKIFDNLSYMVGAGYLWTGDYLKVATGTTKVENDYVLMNKLTLNF